MSLLPPQLFPQLARLPLYPAEQQAEPSLVCVTGASSYVAGSIIPRLLAAGHTIHATVRDPADARRTAHLRAWGEACSGQLKLFKVRCSAMNARSCEGC